MLFLKQALSVALVNVFIFTSIQTPYLTEQASDNLNPMNSRACSTQALLPRALWQTQSWAEPTSQQTRRTVSSQKKLLAASGFSMGLAASVKIVSLAFAQSASTVLNPMQTVRPVVSIVQTVLPSVDHVVRKGESLDLIARHQGFTSYFDLLPSNPLSNPDLLRVGQHIHIPERLVELPQVLFESQSLPLFHVDPIWAFLNNGLLEGLLLVGAGLLLLSIATRLYNNIRSHEALISLPVQRAVMAVVLVFHLVGVSLPAPLFQKHSRKAAVIQTESYPETHALVVSVEDPNKTKENSIRIILEHEPIVENGQEVMEKMTMPFLVPKHLVTPDIQKGQRVIFRMQKYSTRITSLRLAPTVAVTETTSPPSIESEATHRLQVPSIRINRKTSRTVSPFDLKKEMITRLAEKQNALNQHALQINALERADTRPQLQTSLEAGAQTSGNIVGAAIEVSIPINPISLQDDLLAREARLREQAATVVGNQERDTNMQALAIRLSEHEVAKKATQRPDAILLPSHGFGLDDQPLAPVQVEETLNAIKRAAALPEKTVPLDADVSALPNKTEEDLADFGDAEFSSTHTSAQEAALMVAQTTVRLRNLTQAHYRSFIKKWLPTKASFRFGSGIFPLGLFGSLGVSRDRIEKLDGLKESKAIESVMGRWMSQRYLEIQSLNTAFEIYVRMVETEGDTRYNHDQRKAQAREAVVTAKRWGVSANQLRSLPKRSELERLKFAEEIVMRQFGAELQFQTQHMLAETRRVLEKHSSSRHALALAGPLTRLEGLAETPATQEDAIAESLSERLMAESLVPRKMRPDVTPSIAWGGTTQNSVSAQPTSLTPEPEATTLSLPINLSLPGISTNRLIQEIAQARIREATAQDQERLNARITTAEHSRINVQLLPNEIKAAQEAYAVIPLSDTPESAALQTRQTQLERELVSASVSMKTSTALSMDTYTPEASARKALERYTAAKALNELAQRRVKHVETMIMPQHLSNGWMGMTSIDLGSLVRPIVNFFRKKKETPEQARAQLALEESRIQTTEAYAHAWQARNRAVARFESTNELLKAVQNELRLTSTNQQDVLHLLQLRIQQLQRERALAEWNVQTTQRIYDAWKTVFKHHELQSAFETVDAGSYPFEEPGDVQIAMLRFDSVERLAKLDFSSMGGSLEAFGTTPLANAGIFGRLRYPIGQKRYFMNAIQANIVPERAYDLFEMRLELRLERAKALAQATTWNEAAKEFQALSENESDPAVAAGFLAASADAKRSMRDAAMHLGMDPQRIHLPELPAAFILKTTNREQAAQLAVGECPCVSCGLPASAPKNLREMAIDYFAGFKGSGIHFSWKKTILDGGRQNALRALHKRIFELRRIRSTVNPPRSHLRVYGQFEQMDAAAESLQQAEHLVVQSEETWAHSHTPAAAHARLSALKTWWRARVALQVAVQVLEAELSIIPENVRHDLEIRRAPLPDLSPAPLALRLWTMPTFFEEGVRFVRSLFPIQISASRAVSAAT